MDFCGVDMGCFCPKHPNFHVMMTRRWIGLLMTGCALLFASQAWAQAAPSRGARKAYDEALEAYRFQAFALAESALDRALRKSPEYVDAWFLKAQLHRDLDRDDVAEVLQHALNLDGEKFPFGWIELAQIHWENGHYDQGLATLRTLDGMALPLTVQAQDKRQWVEAGLRFSAAVRTQDHEHAGAILLQGRLNTDAEEYYGALDLTGRRMVFTRHGITDAEELRLPGVAGGEDFFESFKNENGAWTSPVPLRGINTRMNEGAPALSGDGRVMVFAACETPRNGYGPRQGKGSCDLFESIWDESTNQWSLGKNLGAPNSAGWESQPTLSADGNTLVFAKSAKGNITPSDLVISHRLENGGWSSPKPLPGQVNTSRVEESPFLHPDGMTLYFSSDGHPGFGRLDVFVSRRQDDGSWGEPVNLGPGINSHNKDNSLMVLPQGGQAMFASTKDGGDLDFWEVSLPLFGTPLDVVPLRGIVVDALSGERLEAKVELVDLETGQNLGSITSTIDDGFTLPMPEQGAYSFGAIAQGHLFGMTTFDMRDEATTPEPFVKIELARIETGSSFQLESIQFETGRADLRQAYQAGCERMAQWMTTNPGVNVLVVGHTDNVGDAEDNLVLSLNRAEQVKAYLVDRGVEAGRIQVDGKGDLEPMAPNDSEAGRAANRRVVVRILETK